MLKKARQKHVDITLYQFNHDFVNNPVNGKFVLSEKKFLSDMAM